MTIHQGMRIRIRQARTEDAHALAGLWEEMAAFHAELARYWRIKAGCKEDYAAHMQSVVRDANRAVFVAHDDGKIVGFILVQLDSRARVFVENVHGLVVDLAVTEDYRRQGIGTRLVARATRWFGSRGVETMEVRIATANPLSSAFWKKQGFEPYMAISRRTLDSDAGPVKEGEKRG
jgi:GNAT superfamily N-acetyltransferase